MSTKHIVMITIVIMVILAGIVGVLYLENKNQQEIARRNQEFTQKLTAGRDLLLQGNTEDSIKQFDQALANATTKNDEALARVNLGTSYVRLDPVKGIDILKEVSLDESLPLKTRADAVIYVLDYYIGKKDFVFAFDHIFTGPQWETFAQGVVKDRLGAELSVRRGYEWSTQLASRYVAEYRIGLWYTRKITKANANDLQTKELIRTVQERVNKGNIALANERRNAPYLRANGLNLRGLVLQGLYRGGVVRSDEVMASFEEALSLYEVSSGPTNLIARSGALYVRFNIASFLLTLPDMEKDKIMSVLKPMYESSNLSFFTFLRNEADVEKFGTDPTRKTIITLAKLDQSFRNMLLGIGWNERDFQ